MTSRARSLLGGLLLAVATLSPFAAAAGGQVGGTVAALNIGDDGTVAVALQTKSGAKVELCPQAQTAYFSSTASPAMFQALLSARTHNSDVLLIVAVEAGACTVKQVQFGSF